MALQDADVGTRQIARETVRRLRRRLITPFLVNRDYQGQFSQGVGKVQAIKYESTVHADDADTAGPADNAVATPDFNMALEWPSATNQDDMSYVDFEPNDAVMDQWFTPYRAVQQVPGNPAQRAAEYLARRLAVKLDQQVTADFITKLAAVSGRATTITGGASNYIADTGKNAGDADQQVLDFFTTFELYADAQGFGTDAEAPVNAVVMMNPEVWAAVRTKLLGGNYADALNTEILRQGTVFGGGADRMLRGQYNGLAIVVSSRIPKVQITSKDHWQVLAFSRDAYTLATLSPVMEMYEPDRNGNPLGDGTTAGANKVGSLVREFIPFGGLLVDDRLARVLRVRAEA